MGVEIITELIFLSIKIGANESTYLTLGKFFFNQLIFF